MLSPHNPSIVWLGGNRLFKSYNRGDTWVASAGSHQEHRSQHRRADGRAGRSHAALEERRRRLLQHDHLDLGIAGHAGCRLGRHRRRERAGEPRLGRSRSPRSARAMPGLPANHQYWISRIDASHFDPAHRVRVGRRPSQRRPEAVPVRDARLRQDLAEHRRQPAGVGQHPGGSRGSEEQGSALRRHRVRAVHLARRRQAVAAVHEQPADGARRRHPRSTRATTI